MFRRARKNRRKNQIRRPAESIRKSVGLVVKTIFGLMLTVGMGVMFIMCHDVVTQCDYFKTEEIIIEGGSMVTRDEILHAAGIEVGVNTFAVNLARVRERLPEHPWIAEAEAYRDSLKTIRIRIREHKPLAVIDLGRRFVINHDGDIFKEASEEDCLLMPVIMGVDYADWRMENTSDNQVFSAVMEILAMGASDTGGFAGSVVREIRVDREIGLTLCLEGPVVSMRLGYGDYRLKEKRAVGILTYISNTEGVPVISDLDLQSPDFIVAKIAETDKKSASLKNRPKG